MKAHQAFARSPDLAQRITVAEHIRHEQVKNWPEVYRTFTPHEEDAYYDVVPFQTRFRRMKGVSISMKPSLGASRIFTSGSGDQRCCVEPYVAQQRSA